MQIPDTMRAEVIHRFGGPEELTAETVDVPDLGPDEVLIQVHTAGVGVWDPYEREGEMAEWMEDGPSFPYILGSDGSGTVAAVGDQVDRFAVGDRVFAAGFLNPKGGFYAEYAAVAADVVAPLPDGLSLQEAGALGVDGVTALQGLRALDLAEDQSILIFGAGGGVGHLAVQLARQMGARVFAVASGDDGVALAEELGAEAAVDGKGGDVAGAIHGFDSGSFDAALFLATGSGLDAAVAAIRDGGRVAWPNGVDVSGLPEHVEGSSYNGEAGRDSLESLVAAIEAGPFRVHIAETFPLDRAADAHKALHEHYLGKLALSVGA